MKTRPWGRRRSAWALLLILIAASNSGQARWREDVDPGDSGGGNPPPAPPVYVFPANGFDWEAPDRYSMWVGAWHERGGATRNWPVETYNPDYVNPSKWVLYLMGCQSEADFRYDLDPDNHPKGKTKYEWSWDGKQTAPSSNCYLALDFPEQGNYPVTLRVTYEDSTQETWTNPVRVEDFLVVVLGDSSASGEGAPDSPLHGPGGIEYAQADWVDNRCHRSANAGGAQAAERLENSSKYSSVTFISFACSGATLIADSWYNDAPLAAVDPYEIEDTLWRGVGLTGPYAGIEPLLLPNGDPDFSQKLPAQTEALRRALRRVPGDPMRKVDALIVAAGINDVRFSDLAAVCVLYDQCYAETVGDEFNEIELTFQFEEDLAYIQPGWDVLRRDLFPEHDPIEADTALALSYPGFFRDDDGSQCWWILDDAIPLWVRIIGYTLGIFDLGWTSDEIDWAERFWAVWLNDEVEQAATRNGFTFVGTIPERFERHGMCAEDRWINTATDAAYIQGDDTGQASVFASMFSKGTAHPNEKGYKAYADEILNHLAYLTDNTAPVPQSDKIWGTEGLEKFLFGELLYNDYDADGDELKAWVSTLPAQGQVTMDDFGFAYWDVSGVQAPHKDSFFYTVSDGLETRLARVDLYLAELVLKVVTAISGSGDTQPISIGGLVGSNRLEPPYRVLFPEFPSGLPDERYGSFRTVAGEDRLWYTPPTVDKPVKFELRFQVQSETLNRDSLSYGQAVDGMLELRVEPAKK